MPKKIQLNDKEYQCPSSWDDVTVADQIRIAEIATKHTGLTSQLQLISGYANIPVDEIKRTHINKLPKLVKHLSFINEPLSKEPISEFEHKGHKYYVMDTLLNGEFQDFISLEAAIANNKDKVYNALPLMVAILAKREGETLDSYDVEERAKEFYDLPIEIANRLSTFFLNYATISQVNTPTFLNQFQKETNQEAIKRLDELENTTKQLDGQGLRGRLQKKTLQEYLKSFREEFLSS